MKLRILLVPHPGYGHTLTLLGLGGELRKLGCEVKFLCTGFNHDLVKKQGYDIYPYAIRWNAQGIEDTVKLELYSMRSFKPQIVMHDWRITVGISSRIAKIPFVVSIMRCEMFIGYKIINTQLPDKFTFKDRELLKAINSLMSQNSLKPIFDYRQLLLGDLLLIPSIPEMDPLPDNLDDSLRNRIQYTGPIIFEFGKISPKIVSWLRQRKSQGKCVICLTMGTAIDNFRIMFDFIRSVSESEYQFLIHTGSSEVSKAIINRIGSIPSNILICGAVPLSELMKYSDILIHHCGHKTLQTAILAGKPSLTFSTGEYDREDNAIRLERLGVGIHMKEKNMNVLPYVAQLLSIPAFQERSLYFRKRLLSYGDVPTTAGMLIKKYYEGV